MLLAAIHDWLHDFPIAAASLLVAFGIISKVIVDLYKWVRQLEKTMNYIKHEMELNSGRTMRAAIHRIEESQAEADKQRAHLRGILETHLKNPCHLNPEPKTD